MDFFNYHIFLIIIFISAAVSLGFGIAMLFFYDRFRSFNDSMNNQVFVGEKSYKACGVYLVDKWVMGWRMFFGGMALIVAAWLFLIFVNYLFI